MKLNNITNQLSAQLLKIKNLIIRYKVVVFIVIVVGIFCFMTLRIAHFANLEPTESQIENTKNSLTIIKLDPNAVQKINELQGQNINIESLFNNSRANPFD
jgi:hypothetical protein